MLRLRHRGDAHAAETITPGASGCGHRIQHRTSHRDYRCASPPVFIWSAFFFAPLLALPHGLHSAGHRPGAMRQPPFCRAGRAPRMGSLPGDSQHRPPRRREATTECFMALLQPSSRRSGLLPRAVAARGFRRRGP